MTAPPLGRRPPGLAPRRRRVRSRPLWAVLALAFAAGLVLAAVGRAAVPAYNPKNLIRLHVVAASDVPADQELKLAVRDATTAVLRDALRGTRSAAEARAAAVPALPAVERAAREVLAAAGRSEPVHAVFGTFSFGETADGRAAYPAGRYDAVKVIIGDGAGRNWWCVLYPGLCLVDSTVGLEHGTEVAVRLRAQNGQVVLVTEGDLARLPTEVRYWVLEWIRRAPAAARGIALRLLGKASAW